uniref:DMP19 family protein n=1 Tax=Thaumasiovibrio occultus TaxID=1891184 RepID=UPI000B36151C|nr:DUF4375 domain-containing protein [Thaumasiovibrio occultus]
MLVNKIIVSRESVESNEPYEVVLANIEFLNILFSELVHDSEVSSEALKSYFVDYYLAQVENGGFAQFVYNSRLNENVLKLVHSGLEAMGAKQHLSVYEQSIELLDRLGNEGVDVFLSSELFGDNPERDLLNLNNNAFFDVQQGEDLVEFNARWLKQHPDLQVIEQEEMAAFVDTVVAQIPDLAERQQRVRDAEPRYSKLIRALCEQAGQTLDRITAGDPTFEYQGERYLAWHFITDKGHHYMVELDDRAIMFWGDNDSIVVEIAC